MGFAAFTYLVLLVLRISAAHLFAREYTGYIKEFIVLTFVIVGVLSLFRYSQTLCNSQRDKKNLLQNRAFLLLNSIAIAVVVDHTFNDKHSNFTGPLFSDLYDITNLLCMLSLVLAFIELVNYALFKIWTYYLKLIEAKSKKGEVKGENQKNCNDVGSDQKEQKFSTESSLGINGKDVLNREPFAEHVASAIIKHTDQKTAGSLTIGLYGPWGSGKTSIFDMMERKFAEKDVNPVIIRFQPWFFGKDYMNLIPEFLNKLIDAIREHSLTYDPGLIRILKTYRKYLTPISLRPPGLIINFKDFFGHSEFSKEYTEAEELREQIIERLKLADIKLIVFIDDLDRLDNKEIQMIFKLVRMIADFPKITYVIAMDEEIVTNSLAQMYSKEFSADVGKNYLEKFIQIPLYIPSPDPILLANLGWELLEPVLDKEWGTANQQQIKNILIEMETSPRNLQRLSNICKVYMPLMGNDVHKLDLFSLLTIKVSTPGLFDFILKHADFSWGK